jgi:hypothetical protein
MSTKLSLDNIMRITILSALRALANVNTSIVGLFTDEEPIISNYGASRNYLEALSVANHFGSNSTTYRLAAMMFAQNPNILTGKGYLTIIPQSQSALAQPAILNGSVSVDFTTLTETDYIIRAAVDGGAQSDIAIGTIDSTSIATIADSLNSAGIVSAGLIFTVSGEVTAAKVVLKTVATGAAKSIEVSIPTTSPASGTDIGGLIGIEGLATGSDAGVERLKDAIIRTANSINYFGIIANKKLNDADFTEVAKLVQGLDKLIFMGSALLADITGIFKDTKDAGLTHTRCLYYSNSAADALDYTAGYASRALSMNLDGSNTAITMHLKEIIGLVADPGATQDVLDSAKENGVDIYPDFGVPKIYTSGANKYFDQIFFELALKVRLQIAGFNYLAQTQSKIPQTEQGMDGLKKVWRGVCDTFVTNGFCAPGTWTESIYFGTPDDHVRNIADFGYFIYTAPISGQSQIERTARIAPLGQIALKSSGAIHSADVVCYLEP